MQSRLTPLTPLDRRVSVCFLEPYPWDDWQRAASSAGLSQDLAGLGRAVMREAYRHDWLPRLQSLCGWRDEGERMLKFALRSPAKARYRWHRLLDTDGYRGDWKEERWI